MNSQRNYLPTDGTVHYWGPVINPQDSSRIFNALLNEIAWKNDEAIIFGKHIVTKRKVAWYASYPFEYSYSKVSRTALAWTPLLLDLKNLVEKHTGAVYNSCLLNLYHSGQEGVGWHSDDEKDLKENGSVASLSFGATRRFILKHRQSKEKVEFKLSSGDLLEMKDQTQTHWVHQIPLMKKVKDARVSLTFREMDGG